MRDATLYATPSDRRSRKRSEIHERIFRAALSLFAKGGLAATTVEQITELADVGKGTFFNYFPSKEHVFLALGEIQLGNVEAALEDAQRGEEKISAVILHLAHALTREPGRSPELLRSLLTAIFTSAAVRNVFVPVLTRGRELLAEILELAKQRGEVHADLDSAQHARLFQQTMLGTMAFWATHPSLELNRLVEDAVGLYLAGIGAGATPVKKSGGVGR